jgi:hypothetical protein
MAETIGQRVMRVNFSANDSVSVLKNEYAKMYDQIVAHVEKVQKDADTPPTIVTVDAIDKHMEKVVVAEEAMRCAAEACKFLELACMYAVKSLTA